jgi:hypothetical protein
MNHEPFVIFVQLSVCPLFLSHLHIENTNCEAVANGVLSKKYTVSIRSFE